MEKPCREPVWENYTNLTSWVIRAVVAVTGEIRLWRTTEETPLSLPVWTWKGHGQKWPQDSSPPEFFPSVRDTEEEQTPSYGSSLSNNRFCLLRVKGDIAGSIVQAFLQSRNGICGIPGTGKTQLQTYDSAFLGLEWFVQETLYVLNNMGKRHFAEQWEGEGKMWTKIPKSKD